MRREASGHDMIAAADPLLRREPASMNQQNRLAELHLHLYGTIDPADWLEYVKDREVDWESYESTFLAAYGREAPPIREVLSRHRAGVPGAAEEFRRIFVFGDDDAGNFGRFQAKFNLLIASSRMTEDEARGSYGQVSIDEVTNVVHSVIRSQQAQGIAYAEQRMQVPDGAWVLLDAILNAYAEYEDATFQPRLAVSLPRDDPWRHWEVTRALALGPSGHLVTGIDFSYLEEGHPPKDKKPFFDEVLGFNEQHPERALAILYHVGESFGDKSLESAVRWVHEAAELGAHRLGHAIALGVDPEAYGPHTRTERVDERVDQLTYDRAHADGLLRHGLKVDRKGTMDELDRLRSRPPGDKVVVEYNRNRLADVRRRQDYAMERVRALGAVVEVCPPSNRRIGGISDPAHHPVHRFLEAGVPFVVSSDDPGIFGTTLRDELRWVVDAAGLQVDAAQELAARAWRYRSEVLTGREKA